MLVVNLLSQTGNMTTLKFKTNINCGACIAKVSPHLNEEPSIEKWEVDINNPDKILSISGLHINKEKIQEIVKDAGFIVKGEA